MNHFLRHKKIILFSFAIVLILFSLFFVLKYTRGVVGIPFGGKVISAIPCPCSGSFLLTLSPPTAGQYIYYPGTQRYLNFNLPQIGVWAVGLYTPGGICLIPSGKSGCAPLGVPIGTITPTVGTSLVF